ncbi:TetR family transcriptional regulator C-terminal domain-containing protein [Rhodovulum imhoffii]|uniref:TetR family transcriptional regulator C-terminal domain-containing protein n=1 Tax=Rhodovulum imhoffii TaxID=365340 RepID=UPI003B847A13
MLKPQRNTRIQRKNSQAILDAALEVFSRHGYRGSTLDQIAQEAGLSKPNLLYYFPSKEDIHVTLLSAMLETWLAPLHRLDPDGDPVEEILKYVQQKLDMSRTQPRESRLFANEVLQGAPRIMAALKGELRMLVEEKSAVIQAWMDDGKLTRLDPKHLLFSIWATTQHYADFDVQVSAILNRSGEDHFPQAGAFLKNFYRRALTPS